MSKSEILAEIKRLGALIAICEDHGEKQASTPLKGQKRALEAELARRD